MAPPKKKVAAPEAPVEEPVEEPEPVAEVADEPVADEPAPEPEVGEPYASPEMGGQFADVPADAIERHPSSGPPVDLSVEFVCDRWAGVRLHGTRIKFENHRFRTSNEGEIARLDAWEHARRVV